MPVFVPSSERDLRLDLFRGLANWAIFLGHIPDTALAWLTTRNYGFSDGADLFVFISGYTATLIFGKMMAHCFRCALRRQRDVLSVPSDGFVE